MTKKLIAVLLTVSLLLCTVGPLDVWAATQTEWGDFLYQTISGTDTSDNKLSTLEASYPAATELLENDCRDLNLDISLVVSGDTASVRTLAQSVATVASDASLEEMIKTYGASAHDDLQAAYAAMQKESSSYIIARNKPLGGSHYAYTEGVSDDTGSPEGNESNFRPGSELVLMNIVSVDKVLKTEETVLLSSSSGVLRDPDVSTDGTTLLFSWKKNSSDDFHLYTMDLTVSNPSSTVKQITFGSGVADIEGKYLPNGKIVFNSTRCIQNVDCWKVPVSNLYICNADGSNMIRVGYDQVHTTYPTVTSDGRVIYTRWDYNDRSQMFVQGVFQMMQDGTNQTELFGNNTCFPTTLLHTREIPGTSSKYVSISSGHHTWQSGKMVIVDVSVGRNDADAVTYPFPADGQDKNIHVDGQNQGGPQYRYPYALNEKEFLVSYCPTGWSSSKENTPFGVYYMNSETGKQIPVCTANGNVAASQLVPIKSRDLFSRPSMVNYGVSTGTVYIGNIYEGDGLKDVPVGEAKYLRVVELEFRTSAIGGTVAAGTGSADIFDPIAAGNGAWDIKHVLGIVPIEADGSALFKVPSETPIYFQVLDKNGELIQSMRSWTTLMPNETFSCVGCHEDKNTTPPLSATTTMAMKKGVQLIQKDLWMTGEEYEDYDPYTDADGFSYLENVQPILNESCIACHNDSDTAREKTGTTTVSSANAVTILAQDATLSYYKTNSELASGWEATNYNASSWSTAKGPFGAGGTPPGGQNTDWSSETYIYLRGTFDVTQEQIDNNKFYLNIAYDESPMVYVNGQLVFSKSDNGNSSYITSYQRFNITAKIKAALTAGTNTIAVRADNNGGGGRYIGFSLEYQPSDGSSGIFSLTDEQILGSREKMYYALSYLVLTGARLEGNQYRANATNSMTNWISSMSQCEMLDPYQYGSSQSGMISMLEKGHNGVYLSEAQLNTLRTWIDLGVPFRGEYDASNNWSSGDMKEYEEKQNKHTYYERLDQSTKARLANGGVDDIEQKLSISYVSGGSVVGSATGTGLVELVLSKSIAAGDKITVTLPEGATHLYFCLTSRMTEALIYVPNGVFEYTLPANLDKIFPSTLRSFAYPQMYARIPTAEEIAQETNLAANAYDLSTTGTVTTFPHATATDTYSTLSANPEFQPRNAIDGFANNRGHGTYPVQSWGPNQGVSAEFKIDFGRNVKVNRYVVTIRGDFPHDGGFTDAEAVFSDGTVQPIILETTKDQQEFTLPEPVETTSFVLRLTGEAGKWSSITEVEVYGSDVAYSEPTGDVLDAIPVSGTITSHGSTTDKVTVQLIPEGSNTVAYETSGTGSSVEYLFDDVAPGVYTMRISKANHVSREFTVTVRTTAVVHNAVLCLIGDVDVNGAVEAADLTALAKHVSKVELLVSSSSLSAADVTENGKLGANDLSALARIVASIK